MNVDMINKTRRAESGAVLYVALIMLILLALIGIVAMQVAGQQERMSANYQASQLAFQRAEGTARAQETSLKDEVLALRLPTTSLPPTDCTTVHDAAGWTNTTAYVRRLDLCFSWGGMDYPSDESERTDQIYQVTAFAKDRPLLSSSEAVVDTVFIP